MTRTIRHAVSLLGRLGGIATLTSLSALACNTSPPVPDVFTLHPADFRPIDPPPFWWGVSASSYQTEDQSTGIAKNGFLTDWDLFRQTRGGEARDDRVASYSNFERDLTALKQLGVTHYRFSIEWARVEPTPGTFDEPAIQNYVNRARRLREEGIEPIVCLWHFTFPDWLCNFANPLQHGWMNPGAADAWELYVATMSLRLAPYVQTFAPQNEPNAYAFGMMVGAFPPGLPLGEAYYEELTRAEVRTFLQAASIIRASRADAIIVSIQNIIHWKRDSFDWFGLYDKALAYNYMHLDGIAIAIDYLGFNYYQSEVVSPLSIFLGPGRTGENFSDMGWTIDPAGLEIEIVNLSERYRLPLIITENGIAAESDEKRQSYLSSHLQAVRRTLDAGYDVRGYFHWTLMDCFEWTHGYVPQFGLYTVDAESKALLPKPSAELYRSYISDRVMDSGAGLSLLNSATRVAMSDSL
jgi:beta-glucosidase